MIYLTGQLRFKYTATVKKELKKELERRVGTYIIDCTFRYREVEEGRAELTGNVYFRDGRYFDFMAVFSVVDRLEIIWMDYKGRQERI